MAGWIDMQSLALAGILAAFFIWATQSSQAQTGAAVQKDVVKKKDELMPNTSAIQKKTDMLPKDLADALLAARDTLLPVSVMLETKTTQLEHDTEEAKGMASFVVKRVQAAGEGGAELTLVCVESALKAVDSHQTVFYTVVFSAYDKAHTLGVKLLAEMVIPTSGKIYLKDVRMYNNTDTSGIVGLPPADEISTFAPFEQALSY